MVIFKSLLKHKFETSRASDIFQDWWARMTRGVKYGGSFSEMSGPII